MSSARPTFATTPSTPSQDVLQFLNSYLIQHGTLSLYTTEYTDRKKSAAQRQRRQTSNIKIKHHQIHVRRYHCAAAVSKFVGVTPRPLGNLQPAAGAQPPANGPATPGTCADGPLCGQHGAPVHRKRLRRSQTDTGDRWRPSAASHATATRPRIQGDRGNLANVSPGRLFRSPGSSLCSPWSYLSVNNWDRFHQMNSLRE